MHFDAIFRLLEWKNENTYLEKVRIGNTNDSQKEQEKSKKEKK